MYLNILNPKNAKIITIITSCIVLNPNQDSVLIESIGPLIFGSIDAKPPDVLDMAGTGEDNTVLFVNDLVFPIVELINSDGDEVPNVVAIYIKS